ncbi:hypothetical protein [Staphylococcus equorum]|uniref:Uncharacterized protein n=1 Tax=Staphylococcus equorum TaxID=246432 RepID=A0AAP7LV09_9STAP|nr:hypothetical protein [Staphylococcus equorum]OEK58880.1 hypothetical protein ASS94_00735 [Staphylococcus equorum]
MAKHEEVESIEVRENYGFKANLRQKPLDVIRRNEWLEKFNIPYGITMFGIILLLVGVAVSNILTFSFLTNDIERAKFVAPGIIFLDIGVTLLIVLASFYMPSYGSPLKSGIALIHQTVKRWFIKLGIMKPNNETGHTRVRKDGVILHANGDFSRAYKVDGQTSATSYTSEIMRQEDVMSRYHNGRLTTTSEFHITVSQRQNAEKQIAHQESLYKSATNESVRALTNIEIYNLDELINGVKPVAEHYLIQRNSSETKLEESAERLKNFVERDNMYSSIIKLGQREATDFFDDFYKLK